MKRSWNRPIWLGFLVILLAAFTYVPLVERAPELAVPPILTLVVFGIGLALIGAGIVRAFRDPVRHRGRVFGPIMGFLAAAMTGLFVLGAVYGVRLLPPSPDAPKVGDRAPDFTLPDMDARPVSLSELLGATGGKGARGAILIFYRGYW